MYMYNELYVVVVHRASGDFHPGDGHGQYQETMHTPLCISRLSSALLTLTLSALPLLRQCMPSIGFTFRHTKLIVTSRVQEDKSSECPVESHSIHYQRLKSFVLVWVSTMPKSS